MGDWIDICEKGIYDIYDICEGGVNKNEEIDKSISYENEKNTLVFVNEIYKLVPGEKLDKLVPHNIRKKLLMTI